VIGEMNNWANRPLDGVYAAIFIDAIMVKVRDGQVAAGPIYAAIGSHWPGDRRSRIGEHREPELGTLAAGAGLEEPRREGRDPGRGRGQFPIEQSAMNTLYLVARSLDPKGMSDTMGHAVEARRERLRHHLCRPHASSSGTLEMPTATYTVRPSARLTVSGGLAVACSLPT